ncbi:MAG: hypothetical protein WCY19_05690 [Candidatus Gastranaerophilaceae bacterium]
MSKNQVQSNSYAYEYQERYQSNPQQYSPIIEGYFPKENTRKEMAIRKINTTLTTLLFVSLVLTAVSYYFATANEMVLNNLSRQTVVLNDENSDLQNRLDRLKSFNNVDITMQKNNMLRKAQQVIEIPAVSLNKVADKKIDTQKPFTWSIGY